MSTTYIGSLTVPNVALCGVQLAMALLPHAFPAFDTIRSDRIDRRPYTPGVYVYIVQGYRFFEIITDRLPRFAWPYVVCS
jgi:hypothetical protein